MKSMSIKSIALFAVVFALPVMASQADKPAEAAKPNMMAQTAEYLKGTRVAQYAARGSKAVLAGARAGGSYLAESRPGKAVATGASSVAGAVKTVAANPWVQGMVTVLAADKVAGSKAAAAAVVTYPVAYKAYKALFGKAATPAQAEADKTAQAAAVADKVAQEAAEKAKLAAQKLAAEKEAAAVNPTAEQLAQLRKVVAQQEAALKKAEQFAMKAARDAQAAQKANEAAIAAAVKEALAQAQAVSAQQIAQLQAQLVAAQAAQQAQAAAQQIRAPRAAARVARVRVRRAQVRRPQRRGYAARMARNKATTVKRGYVGGRARVAKRGGCRNGVCRR